MKFHSGFNVFEQAGPSILYIARSVLFDVSGSSSILSKAACTRGSLEPSTSLAANPWALITLKQLITLKSLWYTVQTFQYPKKVGGHFIKKNK